MWSVHSDGLTVLQGQRENQSLHCQLLSCSNLLSGWHGNHYGGGNWQHSDQPSSLPGKQDSRTYLDLVHVFV